MWVPTNFWTTIRSECQGSRSPARCWTLVCPRVTTRASGVPTSEATRNSINNSTLPTHPLPFWQQTIFPESVLPKWLHWIKPTTSCENSWPSEELGMRTRNGTSYLNSMRRTTRDRLSSTHPELTTDTSTKQARLSSPQSTQKKLMPDRRVGIL